MINTLTNKDDLLKKDKWYIQYEDSAKTQIRQLIVNVGFKVDNKKVSLQCLLFAQSEKVGGLRWLLYGLNDLFVINDSFYPTVKSDDLIIHAHQEYDKILEKATQKAKVVIQLLNEAKAHKISAKVLKEAIVKDAHKFLDHIKYQFEGITENEISAVYIPKNWGSYGKETKSSGHVVYCFDCTPFEAQLRAYVTTFNGQITDIQIQAE